MKKTNLNQEGRLLQHSLLGGYCTDIRVSFLYIMSCISANSCKRIRIKVLTARQVSRCTILAACKHNETKRVTPMTFAGSRHNDGTHHNKQKHMSGYTPCTKCAILLNVGGHSLSANQKCPNYWTKSRHRTQHQVSNSRRRTE